MNSSPELSAWSTAIIGVLSGLALLAVRMVATILRRKASGELAPFRGATIEWGSYRIRVSTRQRSGSTRKPRPILSVVPVSGYTEASTAKDASCSTDMFASLSPPSSDLGSPSLESSRDEGVEVRAGAMSGERLSPETVSHVPSEARERAS